MIKGCWGLVIAERDLGIRFVDGGRVVERFWAGEKVIWGLKTQRVGFCGERGKSSI